MNSVLHSADCALTSIPVSRHNKQCIPDDVGGDYIQRNIVSVRCKQTQVRSAQIFIRSHDLRRRLTTSSPRLVIISQSVRIHLILKLLTVLFMNLIKRTSAARRCRLKQSLQVVASVRSVQINNSVFFLSPAAVKLQPGGPSPQNHRTTEPLLLMSQWCCENILLLCYKQVLQHRALVLTCCLAFSRSKELGLVPAA